ncbi:MAG: hypothetical protein JEZ12_15530 [Desulfobacterium sp.]|nr:hypothetical protein [Desulfobacterium sp.]
MSGRNDPEYAYSNGSELITNRSHYNYKLLKKVSWLNKSEEPIKTRVIEIEDQDEKVFPVPIQNIQIHFTGYKDLCPGKSKGICNFAVQNNTSCNNSFNCVFRASNDYIIRYPDVSRLIKLQRHMHDLDFSLKRLITTKIHHSSKVARMNYMGDKIIRFLLDTYLKNPRLMHDKVWSRLKTYRNKSNVSRSVKNWVEKDIFSKNTSVLPEEVFQCLTNEDNPDRNCNYYSLIMRIIEHVSGMTDRYVSNEYNRLNQSGREIETQDETYFFY